MARAAVGEERQPRRLLHRQCAQQQTVDDGKDRGVGADAERQRQDRDRGSDGRGPQRAAGETHFPPPLVEAAGHDDAVSSTCVIAALSLRQALVSASSCARPLRVSS